ncbi:Crp/Fnr family transcriptional regulator [Mucilaginibacter auburnensis]|uniref:CRP-like cAMP-binding protein n=1 Tax=Mucilaginibacter auburnensis TaxID=1457233 RepID=A0A2H9VW88_9SPHI|nr:Crp/Fnr family transcriptional regulator [Mucilaginibacter auburnensis]PJJ85085.1 CRP-like cAMP-binding protein [Mucilaginibacter auburnensis]
MTDVLKDYLQNNSQICDSDVKLICDLAVPRQLRKGEFLLEQGAICRHKTFIAKGLLRTYSLTADGHEHILQFAPENTWTLDAESYNKTVPSKYNISAVENSRVLMWAKPDFDHLLLAVPALKLFSDHIISENVQATRNRLHTILSAGPEERYEDFLKNTPHLLQRLPLKMIAAYLGISLKTLNRVRQAQLQRI